MTSTSRKKNSWIGLLLLLWLLVPVPTQAQSNDALSLSVTPTLFEMAAEPTQVWRSNVKVINNNRTNLRVYANVVNFAPQGETGQGKFLPVFEEVTDGSTLAEWIEISSEPIDLSPGASEQIPFTVTVPPDATPGGHFAAIMIGTRPPDGGESFKIQTSQIVTSLFFVRIAGDVVEEGSIREFRTVKNFYQTPEVDFEVRFENKGNVHIQPQGEILITNMWGKERGKIPINSQTHFGNVLPNSVRKFEFSWKGEYEFTDIGRYSAQLSLGYGSDQRKFVTSTTYFWIIPVKPVATVLGTLVAIVLFILWAVRAYVRRMLALSGYERVPHSPRQFKREGDILIERRSQIVAPVKAGYLDLSARLEQTKAFMDTLKTLLAFVWLYRLFFGALVVAILIIAVIVYFISSVLTETRDYEVTIGNPNAPVTLSSEKIIYDEQQAQDPLLVKEPTTTIVSTSSVQSFRLEIVNSSDIPGAGAAMQRLLEPEYTVSALESDFGESKERSVIVYHKDLQKEALALRELLGDFILSALPPESEERTITIYIGNDDDAE